MTARRLLILSPAFPPHPSPATHRARFLARYGPACGWDVEILAVDPAYYEEQLDNELAQLVPPTTRVTLVSALSPRLTRRFGLGDLGLRAYLSMRRHLERAVTVHRPTAIYIPGAPFYTFRLGPLMRERYGVPYVLDYTDPWVSSFTPEQRNPLTKAYWSRRLALHLEPHAVRQAAHILAVSSGTTEGIRARHPELPADRFSAYPFGFEPEDFAALRSQPRRNPWWDRSDGRAHIVFAGAVPPAFLETVRALLAAVRLLCERDARWRDRLRLHFIGTSYDPRATHGPVGPLARQLGLGDVVSEQPRRIPYLDALGVLTAADGILALGGTEPHYTASKIFPCILARRPLLAINHAGSSVCEVVRQVAGAELVTYDDTDRAQSRVPAIADALERLVDTRVPPGMIRLDALTRYSAESISRRIFGILDRIAGAAVPVRLSA